MTNACKARLVALLLSLFLLTACGAKTTANPDDAASAASGAPAQNAAAAPARPEEAEELEEPQETEEAETFAFVPPERGGDYDLVFFFAATDIGDYEFSIAPEESDDWQKLDEAHWLGTCRRSDEHLRVHQQPSHISKFGFRFDGELTAEQAA